MFSVQLLHEKVMKVIQIKEAFNSKAHILESGGCFSVQLLLGKLLKLNETTEAQKYMKFVHCWLKLLMNNLYITNFL